MPEDNSELFAGSVDRSKLEEMKAVAGDDPARQARVAEVQTQVDAVDESDAAAEEARQKAAGETSSDQAEQPAEESAPVEPSEPEPEPPPAPAEDLSALNKTELVDRANAAGIDTFGKTKAELVDELNRQAR